MYVSLYEVWLLKKMKIEITPNIYLYGKCLDELLNDVERAKNLTIYTRPQSFKEVPLSSLEGYFVSFSDESIFKRPLIERLSPHIPRVRVKRNEIENFEIEYCGTFFPFKD